MDDLISRKVAVDALWKALYEYEDRTEKQFQESEDLDVAEWVQHRIFVQNMSDLDRRTLLDLPSADAVQVTRCKDCKHLLIVTNEPLMGLCQLSAPKTLTMWSEDIATHFCGWGERKDDDGMDS